MKTFKSFSITLLCFTLFNFAFAQESKEETFKVSGNCGMCKSTIEKAAKSAGVTYADWNKDTKILTVRYTSTSTNAAKVQEKIAGAGYDTPSAKAKQADYDKLPACCHYERDQSASMDCCAGTTCSSADKNCSGDKKEKSVAMDCCKDDQCAKPGKKG